MKIKIKDTNGKDVSDKVKYPYTSRAIPVYNLTFYKGDWMQLPQLTRERGWFDSTTKSQMFSVCFRRGDVAANMAIIGQNEIEASNDYPRGWFVNCMNDHVSLNICNDENKNPTKGVQIKNLNLGVNTWYELVLAFCGDSNGVHARMWLYYSSKTGTRGSLVSTLGGIDGKARAFLSNIDMYNNQRDKIGMWHLYARKYGMFVGTIKYANSFNNLRFIGQMGLIKIGVGAGFKFGNGVVDDSGSKFVTIEHLYNLEFKNGKSSLNLSENPNPQPNNQKPLRDANWDCTVIDIVGNMDGVFAPNSHDSVYAGYATNEPYKVRPYEAYVNADNYERVLAWGGIKRFSMQYSAGMTRGAVGQLQSKTGYKGYSFNLIGGLDKDRLQPGYSYYFSSKSIYPQGARYHISGLANVKLQCQDPMLMKDFIGLDGRDREYDYGFIFGISFGINNFSTVQYQHPVGVYLKAGNDLVEVFTMFYTNGDLYIKQTYDNGMSAAHINVGKLGLGSHTLVIFVPSVLPTKTNNPITGSNKIVMCLDGVVSEHVHVVNYTAYHKDFKDCIITIGNSLQGGNAIDGDVNKFFFTSMRWLMHHGYRDLYDSIPKMRAVVSGLCNEGCEGGLF